MVGHTSFRRTPYHSITAIRRHLSALPLHRFLEYHGLISKSVQCLKCRKRCSTESRGKNEERMWRCIDRKCRAWRSLKTQTLFYDMDTPFSKIIEVIVGWLLKYPTSVIVKETELDSKTVAKLLHRFRELIAVWLEEECSNMIGGEGHEVEVDESAFGKRKYNRGRILKTQWVVGGVDRRTKHVFFTKVEKRDKTTLRGVLAKFIRPGTVVKTDAWKGYKLDGLGFKRHDVVNHSKNFVNPNDPSTHTQTIESQWAKAKRDLRRRIGRMSPSCFEDYLVEWVWRSRFSSVDDLMYDFAKACRVFYP